MLERMCRYFDNYVCEYLSNIMSFTLLKYMLTTNKYVA